MRRLAGPGLTALALAITLLAAAPAARAELDILPLEKVRKGMTGYGLTVFEGTRIERFPVEVVDVLRGFLPKQDCILVRCGGRAANDVFGIAAGMSGSPIYLDGKLAGALAYGWTFMNEALAGITPIEAMIRDTDRPLHGPAKPAPTVGTPAPKAGSPVPRIAGSPVPRFAGSPALRSLDARLRPLPSPLLVSGLSPAALARLREDLAPFPLRVVRAGGGGGARPGLENVRLEPGASCVVDLMRGDVSAFILGTVTAVDGDRVLAFGHSLYDTGERVWPLSTGWVNYTMGSNFDAFKMAESGHPVGALIQDRQAAVAGTIGRDVPLIPAVVRVRNAVTKHEAVFRVEVIRDPFFTTGMLGSLVGSAVSVAESSLGPSRTRVELRIKLAGREKPVVYRDLFTSSFMPSAWGATGMVNRLLDNPFREVRLESMELDAEVSHDEGTARIESVATDRTTVAPGETIRALVTLRPPKGERIVVALPVTIPRETPTGRPLAIRIHGGDDLVPDVPVPDDVEGIIRLIESYAPSTDLIAEIQVPRVDVSRRGRIVRGVPASVLDGLLPSHGVTTVSLRQAVARTRVATSHAIRGNATLQISVVQPGR